MTATEPELGPRAEPNYQIQQATGGDWMLVAWNDTDGDVLLARYTTALDAALALARLLDRQETGQ